MLPEKFEKKLDFFNKIRYFLARQHVSTSARQHVSTSARQHVSTSARQHVSTSARQPHNCALNQHKNFRSFFPIFYPYFTFTHIRNPSIFIHPALPRPDG